MEYEDGHIGESSLPESTDYGRPEELLMYPVKGSIAAVYPTDDENETQGQLIVDVFCFDMERTLFRVPIFTPAFHKDTNPADDEGRQTVAARKRNVYDGESWTPSVGTLCLVSWYGRPPNILPFVSHFIPTNAQSLPHPDRKENIFPREAQAMTKFDAEGTPAEEFASRLQPTESETPRWTRVQNGSAVEIDNRGNINLQASINREPIEKERYDSYDYANTKTKTTPDPEGNIVLSTRGAKRGNIGLITGRVKTQQVVKTLLVFENGGTREHRIVMTEAVDETNEEGNILLSTLEALLGNIDLEVGSNGKVHLGKRTAAHNAVLGDRLLEWIAEKLITHVHGNVFPGSSVTSGPNLNVPDILSTIVFCE